MQSNILASTIAAAVLLLLGLGLPRLSGAQTVYESGWDPRFFAPETPGINAVVYATDGSLYVGGGFSRIGGVQTGPVARWDGKQWSEVGEGITGTVSAFEVDGAGNVYAAGQLNIQGTATRVVRWNGHRWEDMGLHQESPALALIVTPTGHVYAGGGTRTCYRYGCSVSGGGLFRHDGAGWFTVLEDGQVLDLEVNEKGVVYSLTHLEDGSYHIHAWDPGASEGRELPIPEGVSTVIYDMVINGAGQLVVCGYTSGLDIGASNSGVARWDGVKWDPVGSTSSSHVPVQLAVGSHEALHLVRNDRSQSNYILERLSKEGQWTPLDTLGNSNDTSHIRVLAAEDSFFIAGAFRDRETGIKNLAVWDGSSFHDIVPHGWGADGTVMTVATGADGMVYVGGSFSRIGGIQALNVAKWDGVVWTPLGGGTDGDVIALIVTTEGHVIAGGSFKTAGGVEVNGIAKWDGQGWTPLNDDDLNLKTSEFGTDELGRIYVNGLSNPLSFKTKVAIWDGTTWSAFGEDFEVDELAVIRSDRIFVAGLRYDPGGNLEKGIFLWDGQQWSLIGAVSDPYQDKYSGVNELLAISDTLYAGGIFLEIDGVPASRIAMWDGERWHPVTQSEVEGGASARVMALTSDSEGRLYAGGDFEWMTSIRASGLAVWDGNQWNALDGGVGGVSGRVSAVTIAPDGSLLVAGQFTTAGSTESYNIARWTGSMMKRPPDDVSGISYTKAYPNPFAESFQVAFRNEESQEIRLLLYDLLGREVYGEDRLLLPGTHNLKVDAPDLASGVYILSITADGFRSDVTLVHVR